MVFFVKTRAFRTTAFIEFSSELKNPSPSSSIGESNLIEQNVSFETTIQTPDAEILEIKQVV